MPCGFGMLLVTGSYNYLKVLNQSSLFTDELKSEAPNINFMEDNHEYNQGTASLMAYTIGDRFSLRSFPHTYSKTLDDCFMPGGHTEVYGEGI
jgi:hypothetical protein